MATVSFTGVTDTWHETERSGERRNCALWMWETACSIYLFFLYLFSFMGGFCRVLFTWLTSIYEQLTSLFVKDLRGEGYNPPVMTGMHTSDCSWWVLP